MSSTGQATYSEPRIDRGTDLTRIEYTIHYAGRPARESEADLVVYRPTDGGLIIHDGRDSSLHVPEPVVPVLLAEIDRVLAHDDGHDVPAPVAATTHVGLGADGIAWAVDITTPEPAVDRDGCDA